MAQQTSLLEPLDFGPYAGPQQATFLEPPESHHHIGSDLRDGHPERNVDERENELHWRHYYNLSLTAYPCKFGDVRDYKLHFDDNHDIFRRSEALTANSDRADFARRLDSNPRKS